MANKRKNKSKRTGWPVAVLIAASPIIVLLFIFLPIPPVVSSPRFLPVFNRKPLAKKTGSFNLNTLSARSFAVMDYDSGQILIGKNLDLSLAPASLTKMMTALVALDYFSLNDDLAVNANYQVGKTMGLKKGTTMKFKDLLSGLLIDSANDAAFVIADNYNLGHSDNFVEKMNEKSRQIGLKKTNFINFDGEDDDGHYSTARDMALLARVFLKNKILARIVSQDKAVVYDNFFHPYFLETTDELLNTDGFRGVKTGWTPRAKECFAGFFYKNGRKLITVVLASSHRFADTQILTREIIRNFSWETR